MWVGFPYINGSAGSRHLTFLTPEFCVAFMLVYKSPVIVNCYALC